MELQTFPPVKPIQEPLNATGAELPPHKGDHTMETKIKELTEALQYTRSILALRHIDEASDEDVNEALRLADEALANA